MGRKRAELSAFVTDLQERAQRACDDVRPPTSAEVESRLIPSSAKAYRTILRLWSLFSAQVLCEKCDDALPFARAPSVEQIKLFLQWLVRGSVGLIDCKMTDVTVKNYLSCLKRAVKNHTNYQYNVAQNNEIAAYIKLDLPKIEGLSTGAYKKPIAPVEVTKDLVRFLLLCDEYEFPHPRILTQTIFALLLLTFGGPRPGELIESDGWKDSNEGLLYGDVMVIKKADENHTGIILQVCLRNRKGNRRNEKNAPKFVYYEESDLALCPVTWFLSHALTDGVFKDVTSYAEMKEKKIPPGSTQYVFQYKTSLSDLPIMRGVTPSGAISETKIWTYNCFSKQIKGLGQRAGYRDTLSSYCFRRGYANAIEGNVNSLRRKQMMGHSTDGIMLTYLANVVHVDIQGIVLGRPQRMDLIRSQTSMMAERNLLAPKPPGAQLIDKVSNNPSAFGEGVSDKQLNTVAFADLTPTQQYELRRRSRNSVYSKKREEFFQGEAKHVRPCLDNSTCLSRSPSRYLRALLKHEPDRQRIATLLYPDAYPGGDEDELSSDDHGISVETEATAVGVKSVTSDDILPSLIRMATPGKRRYAYRGAEPTIDSQCPMCNDSLQGNRPERMNHHLLKCSRNSRVKRAIEDMNKAFSRHAECLWNDCSHRFRANACKANTTHVTDHLRATQSMQCLWDSCYEVLENFDALAYHISQSHGLPNQLTTHTTMQYCYEHNVWCASERMWNAHLQERHLKPLNDFCGLIRRNGIVLVAGYCLFCLSKESEPLHTRLAQFSDIFILHEHMKKHKVELDAFPAVCPHPLCEDSLQSKDAFWEHATFVHGIPPFGPQRLDLKRKTGSRDDADVRLVDLDEAKHARRRLDDSETNVALPIGS